MDDKISKQPAAPDVSAEQRDSKIQVNHNTEKDTGAKNSNITGDRPITDQEFKNNRRPRGKQGATATSRSNDSRANLKQTKGNQDKSSKATIESAYLPLPPANHAKPKTRHWGLIASFVAIFVIPTIISAFYLYTKAADQYASTLGFTVRSEDISSAMDLLGGLGASFGSAGNHDADILYEYISSQELVREIDSDLDLKEKFSVNADQDPLFSFSTVDTTIEELTSYWQRMVQINYDSGSGLIEIKVLAFRPEDARAIAEAIYVKSSTMINNLTNLARDDATRYAEEDLNLALQRLKSAREALTAFRLTNEIVDPNADIQAQMGLLTTLQTQQAAALIEYDLISEVARSGDPRLEQAQRRLLVIEARIAEERKKFGVGGGGPNGSNYATTISEFERLSVDREFAERAYAAAFSAMDGARAEATRQSRYLAAYIRPTIAEKSEYPQRSLLLGLVALFSFLIWGILSLIFYALRDRK
jgi:capsular polysaccharide transport system permease protein